MPLKGQAKHARFWAFFMILLPVNGILFRNRNEIENSETNSLSMVGSHIFLPNWIWSGINPSEKYCPV